jgi:RHS repeat-associated protein
MTVTGHNTVFYGYDSANRLTSVTQGRFTAREDDGTGLYYYRARYYHPVLGRFAGEDLIEYSAGDINLYAYVRNNPIDLIDRLGLCCQQQYSDCLANCIEKERFDLGAVLGTAVTTLGLGTMPKIPAELRSLGQSLEEINPYTNQLSRWAGRTGIGGLRTLGRTWGGRLLGGASTGLLVFEGFYDIGAIGRCSVVCAQDHCAY